MELTRVLKLTVIGFLLCFQRSCSAGSVPGVPSDITDDELYQIIDLATTGQKFESRPDIYVAAPSPHIPTQIITAAPGSGANFVGYKHHHHRAPTRGGNIYPTFGPASSYSHNVFRYAAPSGSPSPPPPSPPPSSNPRSKSFEIVGSVELPSKYAQYVKGPSGEFVQVASKVNDNKNEHNLVAQESRISSASPALQGLNGVRNYSPKYSPPISAGFLPQVQAPQFVQSPAAGLAKQPVYSVQSPVFQNPLASAGINSVGPRPGSPLTHVYPQQTNQLSHPAFMTSASSPHTHQEAHLKAVQDALSKAASLASQGKSPAVKEPGKSVQYYPTQHVVQQQFVQQPQQQQLLQHPQQQQVPGPVQPVRYVQPPPVQAQLSHMHTVQPAFLPQFQPQPQQVHQHAVPAALPQQQQPALIPLQPQQQGLPQQQQPALHPQQQAFIQQQAALQQQQQQQVQLLRQSQLQALHQQQVLQQQQQQQLLQQQQAVAQQQQQQYLQQQQSAAAQQQALQQAVPQQQALQQAVPQQQALQQAVPQQQGIPHQALLQQQVASQQQILQQQLIAAHQQQLARQQPVVQQQILQQQPAVPQQQILQQQQPVAPQQQVVQQQQLVQEQQPQQQQPQQQQAPQHPSQLEPVSPQAAAAQVHALSQQPVLHHYAQLQQQANPLPVFQPLPPQSLIPTQNPHQQVILNQLSTLQKEGLLRKPQQGEPMPLEHQVAREEISNGEPPAAAEVSQNSPQQQQQPQGSVEPEQLASLLQRNQYPQAPAAALHQQPAALYPINPYARYPLPPQVYTIRFQIPQNGGPITHQVAINNEQQQQQQQQQQEQEEQSDEQGAAPASQSSSSPQEILSNDLTDNNKTDEELREMMMTTGEGNPSVGIPSSLMEEEVSTETSETSENSSSSDRPPSAQMFDETAEMTSSEEALLAQMQQGPVPEIQISENEHGERLVSLKTTRILSTPMAYTVSPTSSSTSSAESVVTTRVVARFKRPRNSSKSGVRRRKVKKNSNNNNSNVNNGMQLTAS